VDCTNTRTGWPRARVPSTAESPANCSGSAWSRRLRAAPRKRSGTRCPPTASAAPATLWACAVS